MDVLYRQESDGNVSESRVLFSVSLRTIKSFSSANSSLRSSGSTGRNDRYNACLVKTWFMKYLYSRFCSTLSKEVTM